MARVGEVGLGAPGVAAHRRAAPLDIRSRSAVEDDDLASREFPADGIVCSWSVFLAGLGKGPHVELQLCRGS
jgi:hypothetical protein